MTFLPLFALILAVGGCTTDLVVMPSSVDFQEPALGVTTDESLAIYNVGSRTGEVISAEAEDPFGVWGDVGEIEPGESLPLTVSLEPQEEGTWEDTVALELAGARSSWLYVPVSAEVQAPVMELENDDVVCEAEGIEGVARIEITNAGEGTLVLKSAELTDAADGAFWLLDDPDRREVEPWAQTWLDVGCDPSLTATGSLSLSTNDPDALQQRVALYTQPLVLDIHEPQDNAVWDADQPGTFSVTVKYAGEASSVTLAWSSTLDGAVWTDVAEPPETLTQTGIQLSPGEHGISLYGTASTGITATESLDLVVDHAPEATITIPADETFTHSDENWVFSGTVSDADEDPQDLETTWTSDLDGTLASEGPDASGHVETEVLQLSGGKHYITLTATDTWGMQATATHTVDVNTVPTVSIVSPEEGETVTEQFFLQAEIADEEHDPEALECAWSSDIDGHLNTISGDEDGTCTLEKTATSGEHELTVEVTDPDRGDSTATVTASLDTAPEIAWTWPSDRTWRAQGEPLTLGAVASDAIDDISDLEGEWWSDVDGTLEPASFGPSGWTEHTTDSLSAAEHVVGLTVTDTSGGIAEETIQVNVVDCQDTVDADGDGWAPADGDCDDADGSILPGGSVTAGDVLGNCIAADVILYDGVDTGDRFGWEMAAGDYDGDGLSDLAVSASYATSPYGGTGAVYLLTGSDDPLARSTRPAGRPRILADSTHSSFGVDLATVPDTDGDGLDELAVTTKGSGFEVLFFHGRASWTVLDSLSTDHTFTPASSSVEKLGEDVAGGDFDGDGYGDLLLGAWGVDEGGGDRGGAYLYWGSSSYWSSDPTSDDADITWYGENLRDKLGDAVACVGDLDGDGLDDLAISAPDADISATDAGAVFLYTAVGELEGTQEVSDAPVVLTGEAMDDDLGDGDAIGSAGDVDGDGLSDLLLGADEADTTFGPDTGLIYLWLGADLVAGGNAVGDAVASWAPSAGGIYGQPFSSTGDLDGDGLDDFLVGAYKDDTVSNEGGRVGLMFAADLDTWGPEESLDDASRIFETEAAEDQLGRCVVGDFDHDGNGHLDYAFSAWEHDQGRIYLHLGHAGCSDP